ncbi:DEKNAAC102642 [Brettanomyces naardenensis]|uniref:DEKNAAC102642 n=1 Tax=Brettanomyces naardenensis TaxID=13370 RepID=A0A448YLJ8_BRENA|nr:DEKNAAC102642 [Brettanomyces naardenensis]
MLQNSEVEKILLQSKQKRKNQIKLLLLGAGESGKSTVLKQLRLLHKGAFTEQERIQYKNIIWADTVGSMQTIIIQARKLGIPLDCDRPTSELFVLKQKVLGYKPLEGVDTSAAGGVSFLKDFVLKYSENSAHRRRMKSTGMANSGWEDGQEEYEEEASGSVGTPSTPGTTSTANTSGNNAAADDLDDSLLKDYLKEVNGTHRRKRYTKEEVAEAIEELWEKDSGIKRCFGKSNLFQIEGSAPYFFERANDYASDDYRCSDEDILKGRIKTTGITETNFNINGMKFKILDAGGQRSERKKWMHCFQDITCTCFVMAVSEYDQVLFEDERVNRMHEAIMLFESLCNSRWFADTPFILFLNKIDLLKDKVRRSPLRKYFPDYDGKSNDVEGVLQYFEKLFLSLNHTGKVIYVHRTCATDRKSMEFVLTAVTDMIISENLKSSGLF